MNIYNIFIRRLIVLTIALLLLIFAFPDESISGGWRSIGPTIGANARVRSFAINKFSQKMYATTDSGLVRRDGDSSWTMVLWNGIEYSDPYGFVYSFENIWSDPFIDSLWFFGWLKSGIEPGPLMSFGKNPEDQWTALPVGECLTFSTFGMTFDSFDAGTIYAYACYPYSSQDTGRTWNQISSDNFWGPVSIAIDDIKRSKVYFATTDGLYRWMTDSLSWQQLGVIGYELFLPAMTQSF